MKVGDIVVILKDGKNSERLSHVFKAGQVCVVVGDADSKDPDVWGDWDSCISHPFISQFVNEDDMVVVA